MPNKDNLPLESRFYVKSNEMISSKYKASLLENQVVAIALSQIEEDPDNAGELEAKLYPGQLKRLVSDEAHIYRDLKALAKTMTGRSMILEDGLGNFKAFSIIPFCSYSNGVFTVKFNQVLKDHLLNLDKCFTTLELGTMVSFSKNSAFRIYELLKRDLFRSRPGVNKGRVDVEYDLFEFKFLIGLCNTDSPYVRNRIKTMNIVDWEELYRVLEKNGTSADIKFRTTDRLQKDCLRPAQEELRKKSDIRFEYELIRIGRSYKKILFHIYPNKPSNKSELEERQRYLEQMSGEYQMEIPRDMSSITQQLYDKFVGHNNLAKEDLDYLVRIAEDPLEVMAAIEYTDKQERVNNYMGYITSVIKNKFYANDATSVYKGSHSDAVAYDEVQEQIHSDNVKKAVWENIKKQQDFEYFLAYEEKEENLSFIELDELIPADEACQKYVNWRKKDLPGRSPWHLTPDN